MAWPLWSKDIATDLGQTEPSVLDLRESLRTELIYAMMASAELLFPVSIPTVSEWGLVQGTVGDRVWLVSFSR